MPTLAVSPRSPTKQGDDDLKSAALMRNDVAKRLGVSISTVRRLARELEAEQRSPRNAQQAVVRAAEIPKGELAALVFERLEQRHSLSEIVIALRVSPEDVRDLYHTWLVGLCAGELQRKEPALPARNTDQDVIRRATPVQLAQLLAALPSKQSTRISLARVVGEVVVFEGAESDGFRRVPQPLRAGGLRRLGTDRGRRHHRARRGRRVLCERVRLRAARPALGGVRAAGEEPS